MKTFETEKNSIPEGATHYSEEDKRHLFTWFKVGDMVEFYNNSTNKWQLVGAHISCLKSKITPIHKSETTEWDGEGLPPVGTECELDAPQRSEIIKIKVVSHIKDEDGDDIVFYEIKNRGDGEFKYDWCFAVSVRFIKQESPEAKEKREAVQKAMDFLAEDDHGGEAYHYKGWFEALYDEGMLTNYRKGE